MTSSVFISFKTLQMWYVAVTRLGALTREYNEKSLENIYSRIK